MLLMFTLVLGLTASGALADQLRLVGSGATFPYPLYSTWFKTFSKHNPRHPGGLPGQRQRRRHQGFYQ